MPSPIAFIKEHPVGIAVGVFLIGAAVLILRSSGGGVAVVGGTSQAQLDANAQEVQSANQLQAASLAYATQQNHDQLAANVAMNGIAGQITLAQIQGQTSTNNATLSADVAKQIATLQAQTQQTVSALQEHIGEIESNNSLEATKAAIAGEVNIASMPYAIQALEITTQASANSIAIKQLQTQLGGLTNDFNREEGTVNSLYNTVSSVQAGQSATNKALATTIADLDNWSNRYMGGTIAPASGQLPSGYVNTVQIPAY